MEIKIPELALVLLVGASGSGKSTFARKHFLETEIISSDRCRALVSDDENSQDATKDAFDLLHYMAGKRLQRGKLTVIDATNVERRSRQSLVSLAREYHCLPVVIILDLPESVCLERNANRADRKMGSHVVRQQRQQLRQSFKKLRQEGFRKTVVLKSEEEVASITAISREKLYSNREDQTGPFDIIGDVHGCFDELHDLLLKLGYRVEAVEEEQSNYGWLVEPPAGRKAIFLGDLVDRGPKSPQVLRLVMSMVHQQTALCVPGNHDMKLHRKLKGKNVQVRHGLAETLEQLEAEPPEFIDAVREFLYSLTSHFVLDGGNLVVAHAGLKENMQGRGSGAVRSFCMYGESTGEIDEFGMPVRYNWAAEYRGKARVVYGHTPVPDAQWLNRTIDIDTGCVFGGKLTALRYPEEELVDVPARETYYEPTRPLNYDPNRKLNQQQDYDGLLNIEDVTGKRIVQTRLRNNITIREENSIAALEVMSRFAINPKWLVYLPPTMSPCETSKLPNYLEHPAEAINYYAKRGIKRLVCEEKHMGSRAVIVLCKSEAVAEERFGVEGEGIGVCYTRTGRSFFSKVTEEAAFLARVNQGLTTAGFWGKHETDWVVLDCELMPWSAKAQALLKDQYAAVGAAGTLALNETAAQLKQAAARGIAGSDEALNRFQTKAEKVADFRDAYRHYCWEVNDLSDYKLAPFHILATEGAVHVDKNHEWHMEQIKAFCEADADFFLATPYRNVEVESVESVEAAISWWTAMTKAGGEGMVVKPYDFVVQSSKGGLLQPAVKCRGSEYLRIIYGPEYDSADNMKRLKKRGLSHKRSMALREFALGIEALERFVRKEPLHQVHESVFGVLALESEEVDPRL